MRATWLLIISWIVVSLIVWNYQDGNLVNILAYSTENLSKGYIWTPITSIFVHANLLHLILNSVAFLFFGIATEKEVGAKKMLAIFFIGAISGDLLSSLFYGFSELSIGASGGVSSVLGAAIFLAPFRFSMFPWIFPAPIVTVGIIYIVSNLLGLFFDTIGSVSYAAHIGGLAFGITYGFSHVGTKKGIYTILLGIAIIIAAVLALSFIRGI